MEQSIRGLTSKEICEIIAASGKNGVKKIVVGDLSIEFMEKVPETTVAMENSTAPSPAKSPEISPEAQKQLDEIRKEAELEHIKLIDPLKYEELAMMGEIEDVQDEQVYRGSE